MKTKSNSKTENKWYYLSLVLKKDGKVLRHHDFSSKSKSEVFKAAVGAYYGYLAALNDFFVLTLNAPCVPSIDGYFAWNDTYSILIHNDNNQLVASLDDVI